MKCIVGKVEAPGNLTPRCDYLCAIQHNCFIEKTNETKSLPKNKVANFIWCNKSIDCDNCAP